MKLHTSVHSDPPTVGFPGEIIAAQRSPKHVAETKYTICFVTHATHKIVVCKLMMSHPPPPLFHSLLTAGIVFLVHSYRNKFLSHNDDKFFGITTL